MSLVPGARLVLVSGVVLLASTSILSAQGPVRPLWTSHYDGPPGTGVGFPSAVRVLADRSILVVAQQGADSVAHRYDSNGVELSTTTLDTYGYSYAIDAFGSVAALRRAQLSLVTFDIVVDKVDAVTGRRSWTSPLVYDGPEHLGGHPLGKHQIDGAGNIFVCGVSIGWINGEMLVMKIDGLTGMALWMTRYVPPGDSGAAAFAFALGPSGDVFAVGYSFDSVQQPLIAQRFDGATGAPVWPAPARFVNAGPGIATAVALTPAGDVVLLGYVGVDQVGVVMKVDGATGAPAWPAPVTLPFSVGTGSILADAWGDVVVAGTDIAKLDGATGALQWVVPGGAPFGSPSAIHETADGYVVEDAGTVARISRGGAVIWSRSFPFFYSTAPLAAVTSQGDVVVAHPLSASLNVGLATEELDGTTGSTVWGPVLVDSTNHLITRAFGMASAAGDVLLGATAQGGQAGLVGLNLRGEDGSLVWASKVATTTADSYSPAGIAAAPNGDAIVHTSAGAGGFFTVRLAAGDGAPEWTRSDIGETSLAEAVSAPVAVDGAGAVYAAYALDSSGLRVSKVSAGAGQEVWSTVVPNSAYWRTGPVLLDGLGGLLVAGNLGAYFFVAKLDAASGAFLWANASIGSGNNGPLFPYTQPVIAVDAAGDVFASASSPGSTLDLFTVKLHGSDGSLAWPAPAVFDSGPDSQDAPVAVAVDAAGDVTVTGSTNVGPFPEFSSVVTLKYSGANGAALWPQPAVYQPPIFGGATPVAMRISGSGRVLVTAFEIAKWPPRATTLVYDSADGGTVLGPVVFEGLTPKGLELVGDDFIVGGQGVRGPGAVRFTESLGIVTPSDGLPVGHCGQVYAASLVANDGGQPLKWTLLSGSLPPGLLLDSSGQISGAPSTSGVFTFVARAGEAPGLVEERSFTIAVEEDSVRIAVVASPAVACAGGAVMLSVPGSWSSVQWIPGGETTPTVQVSPTHETTYGVIATGASGCPRKGSVTIPVHDVVAPAVLAPPAAVVIQSTCE